mmetsp:Transcript_9233/g.21743  ORF Transcript_9233/g.21743 Transcript_9233/m.21743 type:complete len:201 (-) Transcript_9233:160-762(-)
MLWGRKGGDQAGCPVNRVGNSRGPTGSLVVSSCVLPPVRDRWSLCPWRFLQRIGRRGGWWRRSDGKFGSRRRKRRAPCRGRTSPRAQRGAGPAGAHRQRRRTGYGPGRPTGCRVRPGVRRRGTRRNCAAGWRHERSQHTARGEPCHGVQARPRSDAPVGPATWRLCSCIGHAVQITMGWNRAGQAWRFGRMWGRGSQLLL